MRRVLGCGYGRADSTIAEDSTLDQCGAAAADGAAAALAAGDAPGDGDGATGFGNGAPDCVKTIDVTVRSGDDFICTSVGAVRRKPKLRVSPGTKGCTVRPKFVNSSGV